MAGAMPHVEGVRHEHVSVNGFRMHVAEAGPPGGDPVLLVHGWPQHWYEWRGLVARLGGRFRLICPDLRGLGWSEAPARGYEKEQLADDLLALLDALGLRRVKLIGHDWGGWAGFLLCLKAPERVERYLALNIAHPFQQRRALIPYVPHTWYQVPIEAPLLNRWILGRTGYVKWILRLGLANRDAMSAEDYEIFAERYRDPERIRASAQIYRTFTLRESPGALLRGTYLRQRLTVPTLLLFGTKDIFIPVRLTRGYEPYADDMRVELVPDAGHFIADERPELVARHALDFFAAGVASPA